MIAGALAQHPSARDALRAAAQAPDDVVLAVIVGTEGPSYRSIGSMMAFLGASDHAGALSSGCIEDDLALNAAKARTENRLIRLRYGEGSPFVDIRLPCGGALDIALVPNPDKAVLQDIEARRARRERFALRIDAQGALSVTPPRETGWSADGFHIAMRPDPRFLIFGKGPEAAYFSGLVAASGYDHLLLSPEKTTLEIGRSMGCATRAITTARLPDDQQIDDRTAVVLFFHDHDWEPPILRDALATPAFYIGAQGSRRVAQTRRHSLAALGLGEEALARLRGPIGLIPSTRDARVLAVSVLAEVLAAAGA